MPGAVVTAWSRTRPVRLVAVRAGAFAAMATGLVLAAVGVVAAPAHLLWSVVLGAAAVIIMRGTGARHGAAVLAGIATVELCAVVTGLVLVLGAATGVVILSVVLISTPWAWRRVVGRIPVADGRSAASRPAPDRTVFVPVADAGALSTSELCLAWRRSYLVLVGTRPGPEQDDVVGLRRDLLDEMERRDHAGFGRWIDTGARAASDPGRYLSTDR